MLLLSCVHVSERGRHLFSSYSFICTGSVRTCILTEKGKTAEISHSGSFGSSPAESLALISEVIIGLSKIIAKLTTL